VGRPARSGGDEDERVVLGTRTVSRPGGHRPAKISVSNLGQFQAGWAAQLRGPGLVKYLFIYSKGFPIFKWFILAKFETDNYRTPKISKLGTVADKLNGTSFVVGMSSDS
jgi:hypothetical protein